MSDGECDICGGELYCNADIHELETLRAKLAIVNKLWEPIDRAYNYPMNPSKYYPEEPLGTRGACGIGCDMGEAGPGPQNEHDLHCLVKEIYEVLVLIKDK